MLDTHQILNNLRRPKILIRAARLGMAGYKREADLRFITRTTKTPQHEAAVETLLVRESELETNRTAGTAGYSVHEHIRVLTALLAEIRLPSLVPKSLKA